MILHDHDSARATMSAILKKLDAWVADGDERHIQDVDALIKNSHERGRQWGERMSAEWREKMKMRPMERGY